MRVLVLPSWYSTAENPISGSFFAEQAAALARYGHQVTVFPLYDDGRVRPAGPPERWGNFAEYPIHYRTMPFHLTYFAILREMVRAMGEAYPAGKPDIIHVHSFRAAKYARALKILYHIPYVVTEHVSWFQRGLLTERDLRGVRAGYAGAAEVFAVSGGLARAIEPLCTRPVRVVPNTVDPRFLKGPLAPRGGDTFRFITVGTLDQNKGMDLILQAFGEAFAGRAGVRLTVCGDGPERPALERLAAELGLGDRVTFTGRVPRDRVAALLTEHQAFVLASRVETFGVVFLEAMACGLPIIMTKTDAWEQLALPETGLAVDVDDQAALAEAMGDMVRNYDRYDGERIRALCRENFSEETVSARLTALYGEVLGR